MASKADFTEQEWDTLQKGVTGAGLLVSVSDKGFFATFKEAGALAKHLAEAREGHESQLVHDLGDTKTSGFGLTASPSEVPGETFEALSAAMATLRAKAPDEIDAFVGDRAMASTTVSVSVEASGSTATTKRAITSPTIWEPTRFARSAASSEPSAAASG